MGRKDVGRNIMQSMRITNISFTTKEYAYFKTILCATCVLQVLRSWTAEPTLLAVVLYSNQWNIISGSDTNTICVTQG